MEVLIIDDSNVIRSILKSNIETRINIPTHVAADMQEAKAIVSKHQDNIDVAIVDLNLPDAPNGEMIDYLQEQNIPVIVLTGTYNDELRQSFIDKHVIDYVIKSNVNELEYVVALIERLHDNDATTILVVDDDQSSGKYIQSLLELHRYQTKLVNNGDAAIAFLKNSPEIDLMITDFHMPDMDGSELVSRTREMRKRDEMAIIGFSASDNSSASISSRLLKAGANDFLSKPFTVEEFNCRINQSIDSLKVMRKLKDSSVRDHLTGLYNRKFIHESGRGLYANAKRGNGTIAAAMIDIDNFKAINDTYGHQAGDMVIKHVSATIAESVRQSDIVARYGGEEFCILINDADPKHLYQIMDDIRSKIESTKVIANNNDIRFTVSVGITNNLDKTLDEMLNTADQLLYKAKNNGRNNVQNMII